MFKSNSYGFWGRKKDRIEGVVCVEGDEKGEGVVRRILGFGF